MNRRAIKEKLYHYLPIDMYLRILYFTYFKRIPNLHHPRKFSEKIFCLKQINREKTALIQRCYDKYRVREYILEKLGEEYGSRLLNEVYDIYDDADQIDFEKLPNRFALKITQSSGMNLICPDKTNLDYAKARAQLNEWLEKSRLHPGKDEESYVYDGHPRIICEKYLGDDQGNVPPDIRIYCFNGTPKLFVCDFGTTENDGQHGHNIKRNVYDMDWNLLPVDLGRPRDETIQHSKPENFDELVGIAKVLSEDFYFVRVDLYNKDNQITFGELTWIPMGGACVVRPEEYDLKLGEWLTIPEY